MKISVYELLLSATQIAVSAIFICFTLTPKINHILSVLASIILGTMMLVLESFIWTQYEISWVLVKGIGKHFLYILVVIFFFSGSIREKLKCFRDIFIIIWSNEIIVEVLIYIVTGYSVFSTPDEMINFFGVLTPIILSVSTILVIVFKKKYLFKEGKLFVGISLVFMFCEWWLVFGLCKEHMDYYILHKWKMYFALCLPAILIDYLIMYMYFHFLSIVQKESEYEFREKQGKIEWEFYQMALENENKIRILRHEIANQIQTLKMLVERNNEKLAGEIVNAFESIYESMQPLRFCGNEIINVVLVHKQKEALNKEVKLEIEVSTLPESMKIDNADLSMILNNLLDNAIEETSKMIDADDRAVNIKIAFKSNSFILEVNNPTDRCDGDFSNKRLKTTKKESEYHGVGLLLIRKIVKKYDGTMFIMVKNGIFIVRVII